MSYGDNTGDAVGTGSRERSQQAVSAVPASIPIAGGSNTEPGKTPRELLDAIGELALAIAPHNMDRDQRAKIKAAMTVLVDHIISIGGRR